MSSDQALSSAKIEADLILHSAPAIVYVYDLAAQRSLFQNRALGELLGYSEPEIAAQGEGAWRLLMHPEDQSRFPAHRERLRNLRPGESALFEYRLRDAQGKWRWMVSRDAPLRFDASDHPTCIVGAAADATERRRAEQRQELMTQELGHRVKNMLAIVAAMVDRTYRAHAGEDFLDAVTLRLRALADATNLLVQSEWTCVDIDRLARQALHAAPQRRVSIDGPAAPLSPAAGIALALTLNELATNAVKYGALSNEAGRVALDWRIEAGRIRIVWRESGGPVVSTPAQRGFGMLMIERTLSDAGGSAEFDFAPSGLACTLQAPIAE